MHNLAMDIATLITMILKRHHWTQDQLAEQLNVAQATVSRWLNKGQDPRGETRDRLLELAGLKGVAAVIPIVGVAGAGPDGTVVFSSGDGNLGEISAPANATPMTRALQIQGASMRGIANDGWIITYDEQIAPNEDVFDEPVVVFLEDGRVLVKMIIPGSQPGLYHLISTNAPMMLDQAVRSVSLITNIIPRRAAQRYLRRSGAAIPDYTLEGERA